MINVHAVKKKKKYIDSYVHAVNKKKKKAKKVQRFLCARCKQKK